MARIWANRLEAGDYNWDDVPKKRRADVKAILKEDVASGHNDMTAERYEEITGEKYKA